MLLRLTVRVLPWMGMMSDYSMLDLIILTEVAPTTVQ
jgi:hypothetical protein